MKPIARAALVALLVSALACSDREERNTEDAVDDAADRVEATAEEAGQEVREGARELGDYTFDRREDFRSATRQRIEDLDNEIEELGRDTRGAAGTVSEEAMAGIRTAREKVDRSLQRVGNATADDWDDVRSGVEESIESTRKAIAEVRSTRGPMGGRAAGPN